MTTMNHVSWEVVVAVVDIGQNLRHRRVPHVQGSVEAEEEEGVQASVEVEVAHVLSLEGVEDSVEAVVEEGNVEVEVAHVLSLEGVEDSVVVAVVAGNVEGGRELEMRNFLGQPTEVDRDRDGEHGVPSFGDRVSRGTPTQETLGEKRSELRRRGRMPRRGALCRSYWRDPLKWNLVGKIFEI
jgi:hypothetical protein